MPHTKKGATAKRPPVYERIEDWLKKWYPLLVIGGAIVVLIYFTGG